MLISCWRKEWDLVFHTGSCCFFLPQGKSYKGELFLSCSKFTFLLLQFIIMTYSTDRRLVEHILLLPEDSRLPNDYPAAFNSELVVSFSWKHCNSCCKSSQKWNEPSNSEDICISNVISFILVEFQCFCFYTMSIRMSHSLPPINRQQVCIVSFFFELFGSSIWLNWHSIFLFNKQHIMFVRMSCFCFSEDYLLELWYLVYHTFQFQTNFLSHETVP